MGEGGRRKRRGFDAERELARLLWSKGFAVVRGPASGAKARRLIYPDLVAIYRGKIFVIEAKYRASLDNPLYIDSTQVSKLEEFARRAGAVALIAVKLPRKGWFLAPLDTVPRTPSGSARIDCGVLEKSYTLEEFVNTVINMSLENFLGKHRATKDSHYKKQGEARSAG